MPTAQSILVLAMLATGPSVRAAMPADAANVPSGLANAHPVAPAAEPTAKPSSTALRSGVLLFVGIGLVGLAFAQRRRQQPEQTGELADTRETLAASKASGPQKKTAPSATRAADWTTRRKALSDVS